MTMRTLCLLLVEPDPDEAKRFGRRLAALNGVSVRVHHVSTLHAALAASRSLGFDLTVLNPELPDSTGVDTVRRFRAGCGGGALVVLAGDADARERFEAEDVQDVVGRDESLDALLMHCLVSVVDRYNVQKECRRIEQVVACNPDAVLIVDEDGTVRFVNQAALDMFARSWEDIVDQLLGFSVAEGEMVEIEILRPDGPIRAAIHVVPFSWDGKPARLASIREIPGRRGIDDRGERNPQALVTRPAALVPGAAQDAPPAVSVLVVEDDDGVRDVTCRTLEMNGYRVLEAASGAEALQIMARNADSVDLLLTDVVMPGMTGPALATEVTRLHPHVRVLFMTGYQSEPAVMRLATRASVLAKPFTAGVLISRVQEVLDWSPGAVSAAQPGAA